jgi:hypothetical protein
MRHGLLPTPDLLYGPIAPDYDETLFQGRVEQHPAVVLKYPYRCPSGHGSPNQPLPFVTFFELVKLHGRLTLSFCYHGKVVKVFLELFVLPQGEDHRDSVSVFINDILLSCCIHLLAPPQSISGSQDLFSLVSRARVGKSSSREEDRA